MEAVSAWKQADDSILAGQAPAAGARARAVAAEANRWGRADDHRAGPGHGAGPRPPPGGVEEEGAFLRAVSVSGCLRWRTPTPAAAAPADRAARPAGQPAGPWPSTVPIRRPVRPWSRTASGRSTAS